MCLKSALFSVVCMCIVGADWIQIPTVLPKYDVSIKTLSKDEIIPPQSRNDIAWDNFNVVSFQQNQPYLSIDNPSLRDSAHLESESTFPFIHDLTTLTWGNMTALQLGTQKYKAQEKDEDVEEVEPRELPTTARGKLGFLTTLKNSLFSTLAENVLQLWGGSTRRVSRGSKLDFGMGGALISIAFLTFAVFKIKLIIQLIEKIKNKTLKHGMGASVITQNQAAPAQILGFTHGRRKRALDDLHQRILRAVADVTATYHYQQP